MSAEVQTHPQEQGNDKEINFAKVRQQLEAERNARMQYERELAEQKQMIAELQRSRNTIQDDDDDSEPYVDHKRLEKKLSKFESRMDEKIDKRAEEKARLLVEQEKRMQWEQQNRDADDLINAHADELYAQKRDLAESLLSIPDPFNRKKAAYSAIKDMLEKKKEAEKPSIQQKIDANRKNPYYMPNNMGTPAYSGGGDFSPVGQKNAYDQMKALQQRLRLG